MLEYLKYSERGYFMKNNVKEIMKEYKEGIEKIDNAYKVEKVETGQDENIHVWLNVPSDSEYLDENRIPICGDYLAKKFKRDMEGMILLNVPEDLIDTIKDSDMLKVKTKYRIRNEKWTKEKGKAKLQFHDNFQKNNPFQDA